eukprot:TRINITY_DN364_c0_g1_i1.p1 TRINITY_DN364_c0_g1~~TRINITY_DN364_c0_g1_i1.p1  ORF type:complete len:186 (+),score=23.66 TRINITY_DN364_c0_g1_i1:39-596(+)
MAAPPPYGGAAPSQGYADPSYAYPAPAAYPQPTYAAQPAYAPAQPAYAQPQPAYAPAQPAYAAAPAAYYSGAPGYSAPQAGYPASSGYSAPAVGYAAAPPGTTVVMTYQPPIFRHNPVMCRCPHCGFDGVTNVRHEASGMTWAWCMGFLCFTGCCCFLPFCIDNMQAAIHTCSSCQKVIAVCDSM